MKMRRQDVDLQSGWWTIPATIAKNGEAHRVPLCQRAVEVIEEAIERGPKEHRYVFAGIKGGSVAARAVKGVKKLRDAGKLAVADILRHDLRRTVASGMAEAGVAPHVISCMLNHVDKGARATHVYNRYSYDREKKRRDRALGTRADRNSGGVRTRSRAELHALIRRRSAPIVAVTPFA